MRFKLCIAVTAAVVAAGCGPKEGSYQPKPVKITGTATVAAGQEGNLFPMAVGNQWVYDIQGQTIQQGRQVSFGGEVTWKVVKVDSLPGGGKKATVDVITGGKRTDRQEWTLNSKGLFQTSIGLNPATKFDPPIPAIVFPVEKDRTFSWKGNGVRPNMKPGPTSTKSTIVGPKEIDVVSGPPMQAIEVKTETDFGKSIGSATSTAFFTPNVGIVRYVHVVNSKTPTQLLLRLKSHRFPNVSK